MNSQEAKLMYLLGKDIANSKSPDLYNIYFKENGINMKYGIYDTDSIEAFVNKAKTVPIFAFNVTMPYKSEIVKFLDEQSELVKMTNSCNLVKVVDGKLSGYSTDGIGFFESLKVDNLLPKTMTIIGYGGAGRAIEAASKLYGIKKCHIIDHDKSNNIIKDITTYNEVLQMLQESDLIVNATNKGFGEDQNMPLPEKILIDLFDKTTSFTFIDIIYHPLETSLLKLMRTHNVKKSFNGLKMLEYQFKENIKILFNN